MSGGRPDAETVLGGEASGTARTRLGPGHTLGVCDVVLEHPPGTFAPTPASLVGVEAVTRHRHHLRGLGLDWGSGIGCLAIVAAHVEGVREVAGLEIEARNVDAARANAARCGVADRTRFLLADSYEPYRAEDRAWLSAVEGRVDFILANPPSSSPRDDGFGYRRAVVRGATRFLRDGGQILLNVSSQYGMDRVEGLLDEAAGLAYRGVVATTDAVPFDLSRADLRVDVRSYAAEEARGGLPYCFLDPADPTRTLTARQALALWERTGQSPLTRWQVHLFVRAPSPPEPGMQSRHARATTSALAAAEVPLED